MTATILAGFPDPDDEFYKTLISGALRIGIEYLLVGGGEKELQCRKYISSSATRCLRLSSLS